MKAIYTVLNDKIYRIDQDTAEPKTLASMPKSEHSVMSTDTVMKKVTASIFLNTMETTAVKSNRELYNTLKRTIEYKKITEIPTIYDRYMLVIDYQLYDSKCEICHNVVTKPASASDAAILLGVAANNELCYRRVKVFDPIIEFAVANQLPLGIMKSADTEYHFKINDVSIYQDTSNIPGCCHNSIYCTPYRADDSSTIIESLSGYARVYSTAEQGLKISDLDIGFVPKTIDLRINFVLSSLIVAYDDADIKTLIQRIIAEKYNPQPVPTPPDTGDDDDEGGSLYPGYDHKPADGDYRPNKDGLYDYYERCNSTTPGALLVVENLIPDLSYKVETMIRKRLVIKDIPDIEIGEYVHYVEGFEDDVHGHHHHHHHTHYHDIPDGESDSGNTDDNNDDDNSDDVFDDVTGDDDSNTDDSYNNQIPSDFDRGASLDNTDTASNLEDSFNGFTMIDLNEILH